MCGFWHVKTGLFSQPTGLIFGVAVGVGLKLGVSVGVAVGL